MSSIRPDRLGAAISEQLTLYHEDIVEAVNTVSAKTMESLVEKTKATAPKRSGKFRRHITSKETVSRMGGKTYTWYVKAPDHRLTHLLVHGHAKKDGGRVPGDPFLHKALDQVLPEYEREVEEAIRNG